MAVRATDLALFDLYQQTFTIAPRAQIGDRLELLDPIAMIKVQYKRVGLPAIDAGMRAQVFIDLEAQVPAAASPLAAGGGITRLVLSVVLARIFPHAEFATRAATPTRAVAEREILDWSCQPATRASAAARTVVQEHIGATSRSD
ncbi:MAG: hypothetical protein E6J23_05630 [Chloroflexi bacterium]|nr:MAG: hypothetical protein E6J23_05630 [Chloroflexota bacterium]